MNKKNMSKALIELAKEEGIAMAKNVLTDWIVVLDDMMENASPEALKAIAVLRLELKNAGAYIQGGE